MRAAARCRPRGLADGWTKLSLRSTPLQRVHPCELFLLLMRAARRPRPRHLFALKCVARMNMGKKLRSSSVDPIFEEVLRKYMDCPAGGFRRVGGHSLLLN